MEIVLSRLLGQAERRCTLTHELVHLERGPTSSDPRLAAGEERRVDEIAARLLIPLEELIDAIRWGQGHPDHDELWVDPPTLLARVRTLTDTERAMIAAALRV
jgi:Zn-dependent peptidase ImmA (M78 family)